MVKKKWAIIILSLVIIYLIIKFAFFYSSFKEKKELYSDIVSIIYLQTVHYDMVKNTGKNTFTKIEFENYIKSSDKIAHDFIEWLDKTDYNITYQYESIIIYDYGFNNNDDNLKKKYKAEDISFFKSLFIDGDVILYEGFADIYLYDLEEKRGSWFDRFPPPPFRFPKNVLDSINSLDSIGKDYLKKNYKSFYNSVIRKMEIKDNN